MTGQAIVPQRLVIVVPTDAHHDSRTARIAASMRERGHTVAVIARRGAEDLAADDDAGLVRVACHPVDGLPLPEPVRRRLRRFVDPGGSTARGTDAADGRRPGRARRSVDDALRFARIGLTVRAQERASSGRDPGADLYHGMAFQGIPVALGLADRSGAAAVYDIRDIYLDSRNLARLPTSARRLLRRLEGRWIGRSTATITVNRSCADLIERRYGVRPSIVMNCPPRRDPSSAGEDRVRRALRLSRSARILMYHGGLMADRGLGRAIEAMAEPDLGDAHLVIMGWGEEEARLRELAAGPAVAGRVHFLPPVPPDDVVDWVGSADASIMVNQPTTLNERLSTPNKLFESLAAGTPVVSSDFAERRRIVLGDPLGPLGAVCDPIDPTAIAAAAGSILSLDGVASGELRARCAQAARDRYSWESQLPTLLATYGAATGRAW
jgi:glycosyltransferase involved in cell wall biosynthesis